MTQGPLEIYAIKFPGNQFRGQVAPALAELAESGVVRIVDVYFISRAEDGSLDVSGMDSLNPEEQAVFGAVIGQEGMRGAGQIPETDLIDITPLIEEGESGIAVVIENLWATRLAESLQKVNATLLTAHGIPRGDLIATGNLTLEERLEAGATVVPEDVPDDAWEKDNLFDQNLLDASRTEAEFEAELVEAEVFEINLDDAVLLGETPLDQVIEEELDEEGGRDSTGAIYG